MLSFALGMLHFPSVHFLHFLHFLQSGARSVLRLMTKMKMKTKVIIKEPKSIFLTFTGSAFRECQIVGDKMQTCLYIFTKLFLQFNKCSIHFRLYYLPFHW